MAGFTVDVSELNGIALDLHGTPLRTQVGAAKAISKSAHDIEGTAKSICPVDTGTLRNSISVDITDLGYGADIGPTASYGGYVEYGTSRQAPQAYMGPALDRHSGELVDALSALAGESLWP